ncbi:hypothetical protein F511_21131 [Dorcoceras hygrometricum]|uniref:Uncharacterized protein n=1 Tax=Dorcoceras hygrometricum TaxID=472368 RepID=A0A2Z7CLQ1_9LAMI|nr:hypothetical protein F511_21131 [Dorcoceras hygrometricum]
MTNQTTYDEVFDFSNTEFTREDLINALNEMVHEYHKLSQIFEDIKAENGFLKSSSVEPSTAQLGDSDSLQTELRLPRIIGEQGTTTQLCNKISIDHHNPNHSDSAGYHDSTTELDSQHGDSAGKSRLSDYRISKKQAQYAMHECKKTLNDTYNKNQLLACKRNGRTVWSELAKTFERYKYDAPTRQADPRLQSGTKRTVLERGTQRHQPCSKLRRKSMAIRRNRVWLNSMGLGNSIRRWLYGKNKGYELTTFLTQATAQAGETSRQSEDTASENKFTDDGMKSLTNKPLEKAVEKKKTEKVVVVLKKTVAGSQAGPAKSKSGTSSDEDTRPLANLGKKQRTKRTKPVKSIEAAEEQVVAKELPIVIRTDAERSAQQPAQQSTTYGGGMVFAPIEIRKINWATHFLPKIDPATKDKKILEAFAQPNPVKEHCLLVIQDAWEAVSLKMSKYDEWECFRIEVRLNTITSMTPITDLDKNEDEFMPWAETKLGSELFKMRMLVQCKLYESELKKKFLDRELKELIKKHRAQRHLAALPLLVPESSVIGWFTDDFPQLTWTEGSIKSNQGTTTPYQAETEQPAKAVEQRIFVIEHRAHEEEQPAPEVEKTARIEQQAQEHFDELIRVV